MAFEIRGRIKGDKEVVRALNRAPKIFFGALREWLENERANMLGGKDAKGKKRKGYRNILWMKSLRRGRSDRGRTTWSRRIVGLFKGYVPFAKNINDLKLKMGVFKRGGGHQLQKALEMMQTGGTISATKQMIVPMYKNLARIGYRGPWTMGSVGAGLKSKAFAHFANLNRLVVIRKSGRTYYFDKQSAGAKRGGYRGTTFLKRNLLFMGVFGIRIRKQFTGKYDFYSRFNRMQGAMMRRGQTSVDKATKGVERKYG